MADKRKGGKTNNCLLPLPQSQPGHIEWTSDNMGSCLATKFLYMGLMLAPQDELLLAPPPHPALLLPLLCLPYCWHRSREGRGKDYRGSWGHDPVIAPQYQKVRSPHCDHRNTKSELIRLLPSQPVTCIVQPLAQRHPLCKNALCVV